MGRPLRRAPGARGVWIRGFYVKCRQRCISVEARNAPKEKQVGFLSSKLRTVDNYPKHALTAQRRRVKQGAVVGPRTELVTSEVATEERT